IQTTQRARPNPLSAQSSSQKSLLQNSRKPGLPLTAAEKLEFFRLLKKFHMRGVEERGVRRTLHVRRSDERLDKQMGFFSSLLTPDRRCLWRIKPRKKGAYTPG